MERLRALNGSPNLSDPIFGMTRPSVLKCPSPGKFVILHYSQSLEAPSKWGVVPGFPMVTTNSSHCRLSLGRKYGHMYEIDLLPEKGALIQLQILSAGTRGGKFQLACSISDSV